MTENYYPHWLKSGMIFDVILLMKPVFLILLLAPILSCRKGDYTGLTIDNGFEWSGIRAGLAK